MNPHSLSILPSARENEESSSLQMEREGFVDEAAVLALIQGPKYPRSQAHPEDLALAADDMDFAGWQLKNPVPERVVEIPTRANDPVIRRATPPVFDEPGIDEPGIGEAHHGAHRWWLAGLAGIMSTMLFSLLLLTLSSRPVVHIEPVLTPTSASHHPKASPRDLPPVAPASELTAASMQSP